MKTRGFVRPYAPKVLATHKRKQAAHSFRKARPYDYYSVCQLRTVALNGLVQTSTACVFASQFLRVTFHCRSFKRAYVQSLVFHRTHDDELQPEHLLSRMNV